MVQAILGVLGEEEWIGGKASKVCIFCAGELSEVCM